MIKLDENYRIEPDSSNWALHCEKAGGRNPKTGEQGTSRTVSYHGRLEYALRQYLDDSLKDCPDIQTMFAKIDELHTRFDAFCADKTWATLKELRKNDAKPQA